MNSARGEGARVLGCCRGKWGGVRAGTGSGYSCAFPLPTRASPALETLEAVTGEAEAVAVLGTAGGVLPWVHSHPSGGHIFPKRKQNG